MNESVSSSRTAKPAPTTGESAGTPSPAPAGSGVPLPVVRDDQPTVISRRAPLGPSEPPSALARRIAAGQVMPGDRLGHFELLEYVGGGGMGRVLRARDSRLGRIVAMKVLLPEQAADEETLLRFHNEAQSTARLDHPNIVRVYHKGEDQGLHYIAFEFVEGLNVRRLVEQKGRLPLAEAVSYTLQVAQALEHAAGRQVIHRDIKPSNVLITPEGQVKLIDLGLARLQQDSPAGADLTASGVTLGTFDYISPEQARDPRAADVRSDLYSLGCTFFYMLTGRPPFPEGTVLQKLLQHQGDRPPDVRHFRPELPQHVSRILQKMLAKEPKHRYADPGALVDDLAALATEVGLRPTRREGKVWLAPPSTAFSFLQRNLPWMVPVAVLLAAVLLLDRFWSNQARNVPQTPLAGQNTPGAPATRQPVPAAQPETQTPENPPECPKPSGAGAAGPSVSTPGSSPGPPPPSSPPRPKPAVPAPPGREPRVPVVEPTSPWERMLAERPIKQGLGPEALSGVLAPAGGLSGQLLDAPTGLSASLSAPSLWPETAPPNDLPAAARPHLLVVDPAGTGENEFATLEAALGAAADGDVIELRFSGQRVQRAIHLASRRLTIRAAEGCEPVLVFEPRDPDPVKAPRSMIAASAGRLTLVRVALELHVPREVPADQWTLIGTTTGQTVRLESCWLTVLNASDQAAAYHPDVAFFRARPEPGAESPAGGSAAAGLASTDIELIDCVARGEATLLQVEDLQPVELNWENGLLATSEQLLLVRGGQRTPAPAERVAVSLRHVTAAVRGGLCRVTDDRLRAHQLPVHLRCADAIVLCDQQPLIHQEGAADVDSLLERIQWDGDRNFYEDVEVFWLVHSLEAASGERVMDFTAWCDYWGPQRETLPRLHEAVLVALPPTIGPFHTRVPDDYALDTVQTDNPAVGAAADGQDAGFQAGRLPSLPGRADGPTEAGPAPAAPDTSAPSETGTNGAAPAP